MAAAVAAAADQYMVCAGKTEDGKGWDLATPVDMEASSAPFAIFRVQARPALCSRSMHTCPPNNPPQSLCPCFVVTAA